MEFYLILIINFGIILLLNHRINKNYYKNKDTINYFINKNNEEIEKIRKDIKILMKFLKLEFRNRDPIYIERNDIE